MVKRFLKQAPLIYAQAHIHFSDLPQKSIASEDELLALHKAMLDLGLADRIDSKMPQTSFHFNHSSDRGYVEVSKEKHNIHRILFRGFSNTTLLEITRGRLTVKTTRYSNYEKASKFVCKVLEAVELHIQDISKVLLKQAGLRYVDVILPKEGTDLGYYLKKELLPYHPEFAQQISGTTQTIATTVPNAYLAVTLEELAPSNQGVPSRWLPLDLLEQDEKAILALHPKTEHFGTHNNYGIMSVDHRIELINTPKWAIETIRIELGNLHSRCSGVFWDSITSEAKTEWQEQTKDG